MIPISYETLVLIAAGVVLLLIGMSFISMRDTAKLPDISTRLIRMEHLLYQMFSQAQLQTILAENQRGGRMMFRTPDGKYSASSPEELMQKIMNDPEYPKNDEELKKYFEDMMKDDEEDEDL